MIDLDCLTPRERQTAILIGEGLTNNEVAVRLGVSPITAKNFTYKIFKKLKITKRVNLVLLLNGQPSKEKKAPLLDLGLFDIKILRVGKRVGKNNSLRVLHNVLLEYDLYYCVIEGNTNIHSITLLDEEFVEVHYQQGTNIKKKIFDNSEFWDFISRYNCLVRFERKTL